MDAFQISFVSFCRKVKVYIITTFTVAAALVTLVVALALRPSLLTEVAETVNGKLNNKLISNVQ